MEDDLRESQFPRPANVWRNGLRKLLGNSITITETRTNSELQSSQSVFCNT
jgi:hypothetical protein